jgi:hypothetical protein
MTTATHLVLVDPTAEPLPAVAAMAPRPRALRGLAAGLLANSKHNSMPLLEAVAAELGARYGVGRPRQWSKPTAYRVATPALLDEIAAASEVAITAIGD